jgi:Tol biopolymer transport system component
MLLAVLAVAGGTASGAAFPGANGRIAYASNQSGDWDIYSMNADGSGKRQLTSGPGNDTQPSYSADGTRIVFASNRAGNYDVYAMNADGSGVTRLTTDPGDDTQPTFSPDGTRVAFVSVRFGSWYTDLFLMNADGSGQTRLISQGGTEEAPTFSPDGQRIVFVRTRQSYKSIFSVNTAGGELTGLTNSGSDDRRPSFSPNGQRIAFASRRDGRFEIYTMKSDGGGATKLTSAPVCQMPAYSPDGRLIAFSRGGSIYTVGSTGGDEVRLTRESGSQAWPTWQPIPGGSGGGTTGGKGSSGGKLRIGRPILDRRHGTAKLPVTVPAAGTLKLRGKTVKQTQRQVGGPATVKLLVKPRAAALRALAQKGKARVKVLVAYARRGGDREVESKAFSLRRRD